MRVLLVRWPTPPTKGSSDAIRVPEGRGFSSLHYIPLLRSEMKLDGTRLQAANLPDTNGAPGRDSNLQLAA